MIQDVQPGNVIPIRVLHVDDEEAHLEITRIFMEREAKLLYTTYSEISDRVARFAEKNGISLVLRFDSSAINADDRGSVQAGINRSIIYQRQLDITLAVLEQCNRDKPAAGPAATGSGGAAPKSAVRPPVGAQRKLK